MRTETVLVNGDFEVHKAGCRDVAKALAQSDYTKPIEHDEATEEAIVRDLWDDIIGDEVNQAEDGPVPTAYLWEHGLVGATHFYPCTAKGKDALTPVPADEEKPRYTVVGPDAKGKFYVHDEETADITGPAYKTKEAAETAIMRLTSAQGKAEASVLDGVTISPPQRSGSAPTRERKAAERRIAPAAESNGTPITNGDGKREAKQALARGVVMRAVTGVKLDPEEQATVAAWIHHLPTGRDEAGRRWWPEGFARPDRSDWR